MQEYSEDKLSFVESLSPMDAAGMERTSEDFVILAKGNSITCHGFNEKTIKNLGWDRECGMAASDKEHDYIHLFCGMVQKYLPGRRVRLVIGKGGRPDIAMQTIEEEKKLRPDLIVVQNGEHSAFKPESDLFEEKFDRLLTALKTFPGAPVIISIGLWNPRCREEFRECTSPGHLTLAPVLEKIQRKLAAKHGIEFAPVSPYENDPENTGCGAVAGVRWHPNDAGMRCYAKAAFEAFLRSMEKRSSK